MIRLKHRSAGNAAVGDRKKLKSDLHALKDVLFDTIGVIAFHVIDEPGLPVKLLRDKNVPYDLYCVQDHVYVILCVDIEKRAFRCFCSSVRNALNNRYDGAVSIYDLQSDDDPQPEQMIRTVMKLIQVNQDVLKLNGEHRTIMRELKDGDYLLYLQPKADCHTGKITGAEALVRYRSEDGSVFPPGRFIPQLEERGLIYHIDIFMFEETCRILKRWQDTDHELYPISLNFSRITLMHEDLIKTMNRIQKNHAVPRELIEIEITESIEMMDKEKLKQIGRQIERNGYRLSLDDFGVSFSNISILSMLRFHTLKIDRSIAEDICRNERLQVIIRGIIEVCHELGIDVIGEGIETRKQMKMLHQMGCDNIQGYLIGRPIAVNAFEKIYVMKKDKEMVNCQEKKQAVL